jgi:hypothetical protein
MRKSIADGRMLPESEEEFKLIKFHLYPACAECRKIFSSENTHSRLGWAETQISGMCENCFDSLFKEE